MEMTHTDFTKVTRMVLVKVGPIVETLATQLQVLYCNGLTGDDVDHQQDHDHQDAYDASLHDHDQPIHDHDVSESSTNESAFFC